MNSGERSIPALESIKSVSISLSLSVCMSVCLSVSVCQYVSLSLCLSVSLSLCLSVSLYDHTYVCECSQPIRYSQFPEAPQGLAAVRRSREINRC